MSFSHTLFEELQLPTGVTTRGERTKKKDRQRRKISAINPSACFHAPHRVFLLFVFNDIVRRTPSANPAAEAMKSKIACGITTVANSRCVATGSLFWTTTIATKIAKSEAVMSLKFRIGYTDNARWPY
jgi:hypothetical protein